jgi:hypothetical protein
MTPKPGPKQIQDLVNRLCKTLGARIPRQPELFLRWLAANSTQYSGTSPKTSNEIAIGCHYFGLSSDWNPEENTIVRTNVRRVRVALYEYFKKTAEGRSEHYQLKLSDHP